MMNKKYSKDPSPQKNVTADLISFLIRSVSDSVITVLWEGVDRFKKEVRIRLEIGIQFVIGAVVMIVGILFILKGLSDFLESVIGISGTGYILIGLLAAVAGVGIAEKAKKTSMSNANENNNRN